jgi:hypothetical protein
MNYDQIREVLPDLSGADRNQVIAAVAESVSRFERILVENQSKPDPWMTTTAGFVGALVDAVAPAYLSRCKNSEAFWELYLMRIAPFGCLAAMMALDADFPCEPCVAEVRAGLDFYLGKHVQDEKSPGVSIGFVLDSRWRYWEAQLLKRIAEEPQKEVAPDCSASRTVFVPEAGRQRIQQILDSRSLRQDDLRSITGKTLRNLYSTGRIQRGKFLKLTEELGIEPDQLLKTS